MQRRRRERRERTTTRRRSYGQRENRSGDQFLEPRTCEGDREGHRRCGSGSCRNNVSEGDRGDAVDVQALSAQHHIQRDLVRRRSQRRWPRGGTHRRSEAGAETDKSGLSTASSRVRRRRKRRSRGLRVLGLDQKAERALARFFHCETAPTIDPTESKSINRL